MSDPRDPSSVLPPGGWRPSEISGTPWSFCSHPSGSTISERFAARELAMRSVGRVWPQFGVWMLQSILILESITDEASGSPTHVVRMLDATRDRFRTKEAQGTQSWTGIFFVQTRQKTIGSEPHLQQPLIGIPATIIEAQSSLVLLFCCPCKPTHQNA